MRNLFPKWATPLLMTALVAFSLSAAAADPIKIGLSGPFTGGSSPMGISMRDGVRLAADEINKAGGVLGRPIQLIERDDEAKNERGVQIAQELVNKEKVVADLGFINTGVSLASPWILATRPWLTASLSVTVCTRHVGRLPRLTSSISR